MNTQQRLREARHYYLICREYQHMAPARYWMARIIYLQAIKDAEKALNRKPRNTYAN